MKFYVNPASLATQINKIKNIEITEVEAEDLLLGIQSRIELYLGFCPLVTEYREKYMSNEQGCIALKKYPVISVLDTKVVRGRLTGRPFRINDAIAAWRGGTTVYVGSAYTLIEILYEAGLEPLPQIFKEVARDLAIACVNPENTISESFQSPTRDITSVSIPGGLSQSFRLGQTVPTTIFERICVPLEPYKRKNIF